MLEFLKSEANLTHTENGAVTYRSTGSACLDLFAAAGALRGAEDAEIAGRFLRAYGEEADLAMKILFFTRDVRGGLGERRVFRVVLKWLAANAPRSAEKNIPYIAEYGRWDDLLSLLDTPCEGAALEHIRTRLAADLAALESDGPVALLAKWLPSVNASNAETVRQAKRVARALGMNDAAYRRALSALRGKLRLIENSLRERSYTFDYAKQPSRAMYKYRKAFLRNDGERYAAFLDRVSEGAEKLRTGTLTPYDIIAPLISCDAMAEENRRAIDVTWRAQEDFTGGENALAVVDGSGSMYWDMDGLPAAAALSLGIYFAERNTGVFRNHFITFSQRPRLVEIQGRDIFEKVRYCRQFDEVANTDLQRVFELILRAAVKHRVPQEDMPAKLYIISDMEFDRCVCGGDLTNFQQAKNRFAACGYRLPQVVFWNVASRNRQQPVQRSEAGAALVSGCSPRIFAMLRSGILSPYAFMMDVLGSERYAPIAA